MSPHPTLVHWLEQNQARTPELLFGLTRPTQPERQEILGRLADEGTLGHEVGALLQRAASDESIRVRLLRTVREAFSL